MSRINQPVYAALLALWTEAIGPGGWLNGAKCLPFTAPIQPTLPTQYTDLLVQQPPGILPVTITWKGPVLNPDGSIGVIGSLCTFAITDPTQPLSITGFCVFTGPGGSGSGSGVVDTLWYAEPLASIITLYSTSQLVGYVPNIEVGVAGTIWGAGSVVQ